MNDLDIEFIRRQFPAFEEPSLKDSAFFENAGGSYMCRDVIDRFDTYFRKTKVQPYHPSPAAQRAGEWMDEGYRALAPWMNVPAEQIFYGPSTSQNTYVLANAMLDWLRPGDEVIVSTQNHEANIGVWYRLAAHGVVVREWAINPETGALDTDSLKGLLSDKTKLLTFPHCSNILGEINPVDDICRLARQHKVKTVVDGVSYAGHGFPDMSQLDADIYLFSLYKIYGPHLGGIVIQQDMLERLTHQAHFFLKGIREKSLYPAGPDHASVAAIAGISSYFERVCAHHATGEAATEQGKANMLRALFRKAERRACAPLLDYCSSNPRITIVGPSSTENRAPTVSLHVKGHQPAELAHKLGQAGILCGSGHFYSYRLLKAMGMDPQEGVIRFSMVHYNTAEEAQKLVEKLDELLT